MNKDTSQDNSGLFSPYRGFYPLILGLFIFAIFQLLIPYVLHSFGFFEEREYVCLCLENGEFELLRSYTYAAVAFTVVLFVAQIFVVLFSVITVKRREPSEDLSAGKSIFSRYLIASGAFVVLVIGLELVSSSFGVSHSTYHPILERINDCLTPTASAHIKNFKNIIDLTSILSVTLLLSAMCTLAPEVARGKKEKSVTTHPFTIEIGVLCLLDHLCGPSCERDLDGDEWIVTHCGH